MVIVQNEIKIIVGIIGMIISGILMYYFIKIGGKKQEMQETIESTAVSRGEVNNQKKTEFMGNETESHVYDTTDLTGGTTEDTGLLNVNEEACENTTLLNKYE